MGHQGVVQAGDKPEDAKQNGDRDERAKILGRALRRRWCGSRSHKNFSRFLLINCRLFAVSRCLAVCSASSLARDRSPAGIAEQENRSNSTQTTLRIKRMRVQQN